MYLIKDFTEHELVTEKNEEYNYYIYDENFKDTLVLLPGSFGNQHAFKEMLTYLDHKYNIMIITTPGHQNKYKPCPDGSIEYFTSLALKAIQHANIKSFFVSGHSLGGMMAIEFIGQVNKIDNLALKGAVTLEGWTHCSVSKNAYKGLKNETLTKEEIDKRTEGSNKGTANWTIEEKDIFRQIWRRWNGYDLLQNSQVPILSVWGDRGLKDKPTRQQLQIPDKENIKIKWIPNGGHSFLIQYPKIVASLLEEFIDKNS